MLLLAACGGGGSAPAPEVPAVGATDGLVNPKVYVFPMIGQMGTDISEPIFKKLIEDVKRQKPDILVIKLKSADVDRINHLRNDDPSEFGLVNLITTYRDMMKSVHDELSDIPQVMWVEDSVGVSSLVALAWDRMYMFSDARLGGLYQFKNMVESQWQDADVRSKMVAAWTGIMKDLVGLGKNPDVLADAMIFEERTLSVHLEGRGAKWLGDTTGAWVIDSSTDNPVNFAAPLAADVLLSDGTADTLDDLMFLLGYREFTAIESGEKLAKQFTDDWRKAMKNCFEWLEEAGGTEDSVVGLGKRKTLYEQVVTALNSYPFIESRREMAQQGVTREAIEGEIDEIDKEIERLREVRREGVSRGGGQTVFIMPWEGIVGIGARHDEIERLGEAADQIGPGQIIVLEVISPGGLVIEADRISATLTELRKRHRVIAWIREAISAAAFASLHCEEIYFHRDGTLGAITMFAGARAVGGMELEAWLKRVGDVTQEAGRSRWIGEAMVTDAPLLSYDKDESGNVKWYNTLEGNYKLSDGIQNLTLNADIALDCKLSAGTVDTPEELIALLHLDKDAVEISKLGYRIHEGWQRNLKTCLAEKTKAIRDLSDPAGADEAAMIGNRIKAIETLIAWWDRCSPCLQYENPPVPGKEELQAMLGELLAGEREGSTKQSQ